MTTYCRLCAELKALDELTTTIYDKTLQIEEKLLACCRWNQYQNSINSNFPNAICLLCCEKLEKCWLFNETVANAQAKLQEIFGDNNELIPIKDEENIDEYDEFCPVDVSVDIFVEPLKLSTVTNDDEKPPINAENDAIDENKSRLSHDCDMCGKSFTTAYNLTVTLIHKKFQFQF